MNFIFDDDKPIYKQLIDQLRIAIVTSYYSPGDKLPSVREFATMTKVNPNTIQRALNELENDGLIYTKRTAGKYVTEDKNKLNSSKKYVAEETLNKCILEFDKLDISNEEIIKYINKKRKDR